MTSPGKIAAVVLAAGPSRRMGRPKLSLLHRGEPLIRRAVRAAVDGGCDDVIVVIGAHDAEYAPLLAGTRARVVHNAAFEAGMGSSIQAGIEALFSDTQAAVIMLADQAFVDGAIIRRLIETYRDSSMRIVTSMYEGVRGAPTLFDRALFLELLLLQSDQGARSVVQTYPRHVATVEIPADAARDIDTPADLDLLDE
ncbi:MAG TPA: nucleotidyltransferase family protein [bacterium]